MSLPRDQASEIDFRLLFLLESCLCVIYSEKIDQFHKETPFQFQVRLILARIINFEKVKIVYERLTNKINGKVCVCMGFLLLMFFFW